jgi:RNA polymerase-binding protein DksA
MKETTMKNSAGDARAQLLGLQGATARLHRTIEMGEYEAMTSKERDWADRAHDASDATLLHSLSDREGRELEAIRAALARLDRGTYGICEVCGEPIDPERLAVLPETTRCILCTEE